VSGTRVRIAVSGIDGSGKTTMCSRIAQWVGQGWTVRMVGNLPRAYRRTNRGVVDPSDPFVSSFFFNHAADRSGDPGSARFMFDPRFVDYVMAIEEVRLYEATLTAADAPDVVVHDRHVLDRRVTAYRAGCPQSDIDTILSYVPSPELTILLDLPAELALDRIRARGRPGRDENLADLAEYRELYRSAAAADAGVLVLDANRPRREVFEAVLPYLRAVVGDEHRLKVGR
jgi:thymidylate kinase